MRSFDERSHTYLGYLLRIIGEVEGVTRELIVAIGKGAQAKHDFWSGDRVTGVLDSSTLSESHIFISPTPAIVRWIDTVLPSPPTPAMNTLEDFNFI
jgi:hypothetical protein